MLTKNELLQLKATLAMVEEDIEATIKSVGQVLERADEGCAEVAAFLRDMPNRLSKPDEVGRLLFEVENVRRDLRDALDRLL